MREPDDAPVILPDDAHNRALLRNVHPPDWQNPTPQGRYNLVVIGAGAAGLVSAAGAAGLGGRVALIERHLMGGDCLAYGCVPSKAVLRASRAIHSFREASAYGVRVEHSAIDFPAVMERMRRVRADISENDSAERFQSLGVDVYLGDAKFTGSTSIEVGGQRLDFARAVIATGARPHVPSIPGLAEAGCHTNETIFSLTELPKRLLVIGSGPVGCELAQSFARFGSAVTIISLSDGLLPREDKDAAAVLAQRLERDGVQLSLDARVLRVEADRVVVYDRGRGEERATGDAILVATGRVPNIEGLNLEAAGVRVDVHGLVLDDRLRTTNHHIFAAGDVCATDQFTHAADGMARVALQNALFFGRKKAGALVIPRVTFTDPEVAHVGLSVEAAKGKGFDAAVLTVELAEIDRAVIDGEADGFGRVIYDRSNGRILGATAVARHAGEMIGEMALAITEGLGLGSIARTIHPYPTQAEIWKRLGDAYQRQRLTPRARTILGGLLKWRR